MPSMSGVWSGCVARTRVDSRPKRATTAAMPWRRPASTVDCGALTAATQHSAAVASIAAAHSSADARTAVMPPSTACSAISAARIATMRAASRRERGPHFAPSPFPEQAAASSPSEWPSTASGATPRLRSSASRATSTAKSAGCA